MAKAAIERALTLQGSLFLRPLGDVGFLGVLLCARTVWHLGLILAVIGHTPLREMSGSMPGRRSYWERERSEIRLSPVKALSFANVAAETHLRVLAAHGLLEWPEAPFFPDFFLQHLRQVIADSPITALTMADAREALRPAFKSLIDAAWEGDVSRGPGIVRFVAALGFVWIATTGSSSKSAPSGWRNELLRWSRNLLSK